MAIYYRSLYVHNSTDLSKMNMTFVAFDPHRQGLFYIHHFPQLYSVCSLDITTTVDKLKYKWDVSIKRKCVFCSFCDIYPSTFRPVCVHFFFFIFALFQNLSTNLKKSSWMYCMYFKYNQVVNGFCTFLIKLSII